MGEGVKATSSGRSGDELAKAGLQLEGRGQRTRWAPASSSRRRGGFL